MADIKLTLTGPAGERKVRIKPEGATIGRGANCDIFLESDTVSRLHARIYRDPFGRWIIEDLNSHNGVFVEGERIKAHVIQPGQKIEISPFTLSMPQAEQLTGTTSETSISVVDMGLEESIVTYRPDQATILSPDLVQHLNVFTTELMKLTGPTELYSQASMQLAQMLDTLVAIIRLPSGSQPLPQAPEIIACNFGRKGASMRPAQASNLHFSKRVLDAVRTSDSPVMAHSGPSTDKHMVLTVVDETCPHVVYSARVNEFEQTVDALYVDILEQRSPKEMFDFLEAVARQINFVQKTLFFTELQKQEKALRQANTQLKEKDRIKDEYVSRVTHDIKGHLAAIQSCLYIAGDKKTAADKRSDFLGRAYSRNVQLTNFVKELLNLTQMRLSGRIQTATFSLSESIAKALTTVEQKAKDKSITLTSKVDPAVGEIVGDEFSINEMLTNLLFNAIKYTPEKKTVHLEAKCLDDHIRLDFTDTGIGIPAAELEHVFDEFFRATNAKKSEKDGTGLGLSIVKQIIERHGGTISVKSEESKGTTFTVTLPKNNQ